jgi:DNA mismatch endonuclease (patch repair protein)
MDIYNAEKRSALMRAVRSHGNATTEWRLIAIFRSTHVRGWRRGYKLFGRPDFVFPKSRVAVFVDGCFWHGCRVHYQVPKSRPQFWRNKIRLNIHRDRLVNAELRKSGWRVIRIWEHEIRRDYRVAVKKIGRALLAGLQQVGGHRL